MLNVNATSLSQHSVWHFIAVFFPQPHKKNHKAKRTPTALVKCVNSRWGCWIFSGCLSHFVRLNFNRCRFATKYQGVTVEVAMTQRHRKPAQDRSWQGNRGGQSGIILLQRHKIFTLCPMTDQTLLSWVESISNSGPVFLFGVGLTPILLVLLAASKLSGHLAKQPFRAFFPQSAITKKFAIKFKAGAWANSCSVTGVELALLESYCAARMC